jgi:hypothetical protein
MTRRSFRIGYPNSPTRSILEPQHGYAPWPVPYQGTVLLLYYRGESDCPDTNGITSTALIAAKLPCWLHCHAFQFALLADNANRCAKAKLVVASGIAPPSSSL